MTTPPPAALARLGFGPFVIDPETGRLLDGERHIPLAPKPFETLLYLARRPGRVVSKAELMKALWGDTFVTEDVLVQSIMDVRRALGDHAKTPRYVQTLPRRGYQFLETVRPIDSDGRNEPALPPPAHADGSSGPIRAFTGDAGEPVRPRPAPAWRAPHRSSYVLGGLALAVVVLGAWLAWRPRTGPAVAADPPEAGALVVMPLHVEEAEPQSGWLRQGLAEMIQSQLGQTPGVHVVARHRLAAALADAGLSDGGAASDAKAAEVARRLRAETLVTGTFVRVEDRFVLNAQVIDVAGGRSAGTGSVRGRYPADLLDAVDDLCLKLVPYLGAGDTQPDAGRWRPIRLATRSLDASRHYVEALGWFARGGRRGAEEAEKRIDEALRLDASFAQAYLKKAEVQQWRRRWGYGDPDPAPAVRAAARLARELPERERLLVESFEALILGRDNARALRSWESLLRLYPTFAEESGLPGLMADTLHLEGRWDDLILVGEAHVDSPSLPDGERARVGSLLARAFRRKGEFQRALDQARRAVRLWPSPNGPEYLWQRTNLGRISLEAGRREEALSEFRAVAAAPEAEALNLNDAGWGLYMAGEPAEAATLVERAIALDADYGNAYHLRGWLQLAGGDYGAAAATFEQAFARTPRSFGSPHQGMVNGDLAALYYAGVAYQKQGQAEQARAAFERLIALCREVGARPRHPEGPAPFWQAKSFLARASARLGRSVPDPGRLLGDDTTFYVQSARLHAVQGRREQALRALAQGIALGHGELRHIADDPDFESLRGEPEFARLVGANSVERAAAR